MACVDTIVMSCWESWRRWQGYRDTVLRVRWWPHLLKLWGLMFLTQRHLILAYGPGRPLWIQLQTCGLANSLTWRDIGHYDQDRISQALCWFEQVCEYCGQSWGSTFSPDRPSQATSIQWQAEAERCSSFEIWQYRLQFIFPGKFGLLWAVLQLSSTHTKSEGVIRLIITFLGHAKSLDTCNRTSIEKIDLLWLAGATGHQLNYQLSCASATKNSEAFFPCFERDSGGHLDCLRQ